MIDPRCGCCEGTEPLTPLTVANRPGLSALRYRVGTHSAFLETMLARLSGHALDDGRRPLQRLTTREPDDPTVALLDAWATVADVLTFYQERIANEGYLATAVERRSIVELARLVGYRVRPGVASSVYLAFTLDQDHRGEIPAGTRAQSVPEPGELPQAFETDEPLPARAEWNAIPARLTRPQYLLPGAVAPAAGEVFLQGAVNTVTAGDVVLFVAGIAAQPYSVRSVAADPVADLTRIGYAPLGAGFAAPGGEGGEGSTDVESVADSAGGRDGPPGNGAGGGRALTRLSAAVAALRAAPSEPPPNRLRLGRALEQTYSAGSDLGPRLLAAFEPRLRDTLYAAYANAPVTTVRPDQRTHVEVLGVTASPFGHNAPLEPVLREDGVVLRRREWRLAEFDTALEVGLSSLDEQVPLRDAFDRGFDIPGEQFPPLNVEVVVTGVGGAERAQFPLHTLRDNPTPDPESQFDSVFELAASVGGVGVLVRAEYEEEGQETGSAWVLRVVSIRFSAGGETREVHVEPDSLDSPGPFFAVRVTGIAAQDVGRGTGLFFDLDVDRRRVSIEWDEGGALLQIGQQESRMATEPGLHPLSLDAAYDGIVPGSYAVIDRADTGPLVARVERVRTVSRADYGISAKVTQLVLDRPWLQEDDRSLAVLRGTTIHARSAPLVAAEEPIDEPVAGREIELDGLYDGLEAGRWLVVRGERADVAGVDGAVQGVEASELVMLAGVEHDVQTIELGDGRTIELPGDTLHTRLLLSEDLAYAYRRDTVRINANVARATHGETRTEVLGSGNGAEPFQRFGLKQKPLTYLAAPTPSGVESTLEVRVDDVRWPEHPTLLFLDGDDRGYVTRTDDDGKTSVVFGDGKRGARLPTGVENVTAVYRSGIGKLGNAAAGQISILATRPLGVKEVVNPQRASGGADAESRDQARRNLPLATLALDRLVSVPDYADFARTFAGIGKASATVLSDGQREVVHLTIAGTDDIPIDPTSDLFRNLLAALARFGDPNLALTVELREAVFLFLTAGVKLKPDHLWEKVEPAIRAALLETFGFDRRELGQDVRLSEIISLVQRVQGVDYVDVDLLDAVSETDALDPATLAARLEGLAASIGAPRRGPGFRETQPRRRIEVRMARIEPAIDDPKLRIRPAQVAYLNPELPDTLILREVGP